MEGNHGDLQGIVKDQEGENAVGGSPLPMALS
jgi:hypothetical protein